MHVKMFHNCDVCNKSFTRLSLLINHKRLHYASDGIKTDNVSEKVKISEIYKNVKSETFYSSDSDCEYELLQTVIKVTNARNYSYFCEYCKKGFINSCSKEQHVHKKHTNASSNFKVVEVNSISGISIKTGDKDVNEGELRSNNFTEDDKIQTNINIIDDDNHFDEEKTGCSPHAEELTNSPDSDAQEIIIIKTVTSNSDSHDKRHYCTVCGAGFRILSNLDSHHELHLKRSLLKEHNTTGWNPMSNRKYKCQLCKRTYSQKIFLENHMRLHENGKIYEMFEDPTEDKYLCKFCGKEFLSSSYLSFHIKLHADGKKFLCSICGKSFAVERYMLNHYKTHSKEKLFSCEYCSKRFIHKGTLVEHLRIHAGIKPHECTICNKKFTHYSGLTQHLQTHTDVKKHVCGVCGKSFRFSGQYRGHMRTHTGDKPFVCSFCGRRFALSGSLRVHRRTHSGERPYECGSCKKGFIKSCNLKQHLKTHPSCMNHAGKTTENAKPDDVRNDFICQE